MFKYIILLFFTCSLFATESYVVIKDENPVKILTPSFSKREVLKIRLENGLEAILISDPELDKSGGGLAVNVGSWSNPDAYLGTAHFLEHMLFLGTKKYPEESGYHRFLDEHTGSHNAFTGNDRTVYLFSINNNAFSEGLDRFAQFFIDPLLNTSGMEREAHAIDQEYAKNLQSDGWRTLHVSKALTNQAHPDSKFSIGSLEIISKIPAGVLRQWYEQHYSANLMHLLIYSVLPIDQLKELVIQDFSAIPNRHFSPLNVTEPLFDPQYNGHIVYITPYQDIRRLIISFELPAQHRFDAQIISSALGYENEHSLTALLKNKHLAESVNVGMQLYTPSLLFEIDIALTEDGLKNVDTVIQNCFDAIHLLQKEGISKTFFDETQELATLAYEYQPRRDVFDIVMQDTDSMIDEPIETYPYKTRIPSEYNPKGIQATLNYLTPEKAEYFVLARPELTHVKETSLEPWFQVKYSVQPIAQNKLTAWANAPLNPAIQLPGPNPYVPQHLELLTTNLPADTTLIPVPAAIVNNDAAHIYFKEDTRFLTPELLATFRIHTPIKKAGSARQCVLADIYTRALEESLNAMRYDGSRAHLDYVLAPADTGFRLSLHGYSEKAPLFFEQVVKGMMHVVPTEEAFAVYKDSLQKDYENATLDTPLKQAQECLKTILFKAYTTSDQKLTAIQKVSYQDFLKFTKNLFDKTYIEGVVYGNIDQKGALGLYQTLRSTFGPGIYPKNTIPKKALLRLDESQGPYLFSKDISQPGNAVMLLIEDGCFSLEKRAAHQILSQGIQEPFFSELRTRQQTGYIVTSMDQEVEYELLTLFIDQSNTYDTCDLNARFELFLENFLRDFKSSQFPADRFETIKRNLITELSTPPQNLIDMVEALDLLAFDYDGQFDWIDKRLQSMHALDYDTFATFSQGFLGRSNHRRLSIQIHGILPEDNKLHYTPVPSLQKMRKNGTYLNHSETACAQAEVK